MVRQQPLTILVPVKSGSYDRLAELLKKIRKDLEDGVPAQFESLGTIHYMRMVLLEPEVGEKTPGVVQTPRLAFSTDYDGEEDAHLFALASNASDYMDAIFDCCEGYPEGASRTPQNRASYWKHHTIKPSAFFAGAPGRTLQQIKQESALRNYIWNFVHKGNWSGKSPTEIHRAIQAEVKSRPEFAWAKEKAQLLSIKWLGMALLGIILLVLLPFLIIWIIIIHFVYERSDRALGLTPSQINSDHVRRLEEYEDLHNQNQFTQLLIMKPGAMRLITLKGLMLFAKALISNMFVDGKLMGIPTIHFARWQMLDNDKRMLFYSNFDGSWQQYLGDFIDKSGWGLTGIWSNTKLFPKTNFLFTKGAYDAEHFLAWSRHHQIPTQVWYCAYPNLSIKNVMNNTHIRNEVMQDLSAHKAQKFLNRI